MSATYSDDCERLIRILSDAPTGGLSMDEIYAITTASDDPWSYRTINRLLCDLSSQVSHAKVRVKHASVVKYDLKHRS